MKLAFLIQAHKSSRQLIKLIELLNSNNCSIYLHIDKKNQKLFEEIKRFEYKYKNLYLCKNRINVIWSGFSQVEATLELMKMVKFEENKYDYVSLISGEDLLIKSIEEFKKFLYENKGKEFIEFEDILYKKWRLKKFNFFRENMNNRKILFRIFDNIIRFSQPFERNNLKIFKNLYTGSSWFTLTREAVEYILEKSTLEMRMEFRYTACSDEHYFQTILLNSHFKNNIDNNNLRYIKWSQGKNSPDILLKNDLPFINKQTNKFIARKFDLNIDAEIIEELYKLQKGNV